MKIKKPKLGACIKRLDQAVKNDYVKHAGLIHKVSSVTRMAKKKTLAYPIQLSLAGKYYFQNEKKQVIELALQGVDRVTRKIGLQNLREDYLNEKTEDILNSHEIQISTTIEQVWVSHSAEPRYMVEIRFMFHKRILTCKHVQKAARLIVEIVDASTNDYIYNNDKIMRVLSFTDASLGFITAAPIELKKFTKQDKSVESLEILMCYDVETCLFANPDDDKVDTHQPYLMHLIVDHTFGGQFDIPYTHVTFHDPQIRKKRSTIGTQFSMWLMNYIRSYEEIIEGRHNVCRIRLFGFNNHNFDDNFILDALRRTTGRTRLNINSRNGKVTGINMKLDGKYELIISDIIKWIPDMSLEKACEDYEITDSKMAVDILAYNKHIQAAQEIVYHCAEMKPFTKMRSNFAEMLKLKKSYYDPTTKLWAVYKFITDYCIMDVMATMELYKKIYVTVKEIIMAIQNEHDIILPFTNFMDYRSAPQLSGLIFRKLASKDGTLRVQIKHSELGEFIYRSYYGGRVDFSASGEYVSQGSIKYMDVTSEYALAQQARFPVVENIEDISLGYCVNIPFYQNIIDEIEDKRRINYENQTLDDFRMFKPLDIDFKGIFYCNIYAPVEKHHLITFSPVALRDASSPRLQYLNIDQKNRVLNTAQFKNLILCGFHIELLPHKYNIVFTKTDYIFKSFIDIIGKAKTAARATNKTKAKLLKLFLTSCAGKLAQRPFDSISEYQSLTTWDTMDEVTSNLNNRENWDESFHYLASFILAEANFILFSTLYRLSLTQIYNKVPQEGRCGALLYMDTDSIVFDPALVDLSRYDFPCSEEIGYFDEEKNDFHITWKEKYANTSTNILVIIARKSYILINDKQGKKTIVEKKLKGVHKAQMCVVDNYDVIKSILDDKPLQIEFAGLSKQPAYLEPKYGNYTNDIIKDITETTIKKSLQMDKRIFNIQCSNPDVLRVNEHNLSKTLYKDGINNFLEFCCSKF